MLCSYTLLLYSTFLFFLINSQNEICNILLLQCNVFLFVFFRLHNSLYTNKNSNAGPVKPRENQGNSSFTPGAKYKIHNTKSKKTNKIKCMAARNNHHVKFIFQQFSKMKCVQGFNAIRDRLSFPIRK